MQDKVTRHMDTNDQRCDREKIGVLVGQTHEHQHASWLYQRHNQLYSKDCSYVSLSNGRDGTDGTGGTDGVGSVGGESRLS